MALSATVNVDYSDFIIATCKLRNLQVVHSCSDRPNLRLSHVVIPEKNPLCFQWVIDQLKEHRESCPKILIYCRTQTLLFWLHEQIRILLNDFAYVDGTEKTPENCLVGMYHSHTLAPNKALALNSLTKNQGNMRVIFAISSLGCGIDCKNLSYVFHFGPSNSTVEYCQQIGRAGRDTENLCHAVLYTYPQSLRNVAQEMKDFASTSGTSCLRQKLCHQLFPVTSVVLFVQNHASVPQIVQVSFLKMST